MPEPAVPLLPLPPDAKEKLDELMTKLKEERALPAAGTLSGFLDQLLTAIQGLTSTTEEIFRLKALAFTIMAERAKVRVNENK